MLRASFRALAKVKSTTGFVNFPVVPNPGAVLTALYSKTLEELQKFPADVRINASADCATAFRIALLIEIGALFHHVDSFFLLTLTSHRTASMPKKSPNIVNAWSMPATATMR